MSRQNRNGITGVRNTLLRYGDCCRGNFTVGPARRGIGANSPPGGLFRCLNCPG